MRTPHAGRRSMASPIAVQKLSIEKARGASLRAKRRGAFQAERDPHKAELLLIAADLFLHLALKLSQVLSLRFDLIERDLRDPVREREREVWMMWARERLVMHGKVGGREVVIRIKGWRPGRAQAGGRVVVIRMLSRGLVVGKLCRS